MKKILFITSRLPYPPIGGDRLKAYWLLKILSKHFEVHLVSIANAKIDKEFYDWADENGLSYKLFQKSKKHFYYNVLNGVFLNRLPLQVNYYYFKDVQNYINNIYENFDILFGVLIRTARYIIDKEKPKILEMTDSIGLNYLRSVKRTSSIKWKYIYLIEGSRLIRFERYCINNFSKTLFVNNQEREYFNLSEKTEWMPNGVNENLLNYEKKDSKYSNCIAFFGKMDYQPNVDAVLWFVKNVLPFLNRKLKFVIVGANPIKTIQNLSRHYENIDVTGFIEDPYLILKSALCIVAPMQTGGGVQNKILECMALGTINIVSSLAAAPIGAESGKHLLVVDDSRELIERINEIYENPGKYEALKLNAREFIRNNFTWRIYEKKLLQIIHNLLK
jgi:glycosyltransferase involved in cell wall biosynthesis